MKITYDMIETDERYAILAEILREAGYGMKANSNWTNYAIVINDTGNVSISLIDGVLTVTRNTSIHGQQKIELANPQSIKLAADAIKCLEKPFIGANNG